ncbi:hypothetical protein EB796_015608 [Bugula neritina]|uniref:Uncharacterized protein n=1 Tax=Bugula neritina TaxID=10212 RepID=A0A7J7JJ55_BUGNE|nr:hypothetical protein EB796_015608 [Bugula neritina]
MDGPLYPIYTQASTHLLKHDLHRKLQRSVKEIRRYVWCLEKESTKKCEKGKMVLGFPYNKNHQYISTMHQDDDAP